MLLCVTCTAARLHACLEQSVMYSIGLDVHNVQVCLKPSTILVLWLENVVCSPPLTSCALWHLWLFINDVNQLRLVPPMTGTSCSLWHLWRKPIHCSPAPWAYLTLRSHFDPPLTPCSPLQFLLSLRSRSGFVMTVRPVNGKLLSFSSLHRVLNVSFGWVLLVSVCTQLVV